MKSLHDARNCPKQSKGHMAIEHRGVWAAVAERRRVPRETGGLRKAETPDGNSGAWRSGDAAGPLAFLVGHPDCGIFQFTRFIVEIHLEHWRPALAGQGNRHLAREQPGVAAVSAPRPDVTLFDRLLHNPLQLRWQRAGGPDLVALF